MQPHLASRMIVDTLVRQKEAFRKKFGREPVPGEPIFFDPAADAPEPALDPLPVDNIWEQVVTIATEIGAEPAAVYAMKKTGHMVTADNSDQFTAEELAEYKAAVEEYYQRTNSLRVL